jgi:hypothetical protein
MDLTIDAILQRLFDTGLGEAMRENAVLFPWVEGFHVLALTVVLGSIAVLDLRLIGVASRTRPLPQVLGDVLPVAWTAFLVALVTGALMFASNAVAYAHNSCFQWKLVLLGLIGLNTAVFHFTVEPTLAGRDPAAPLPPRARLSGFVSIGLWIAVTALGRWIGFTINALH